MKVPKSSTEMAAVAYHWGLSSPREFVISQSEQGIWDQVMWVDKREKIDAQSQN
jgi:hypothetical protein